MDYIADQLTSKLIEVVKKKERKSGLQIKPFQVINVLPLYCIECTFIVTAARLAF